MNTSHKRAPTRLFKKLSALRATLSNEERAILDSLIVQDEVTAHKMSQRATSKVAAKTSFRIAFDPNAEEYKITE